MEKVIELARKLKAMADHGVESGERDNAFRKLKKLLDKYGLTIADIEGEKKQFRSFGFKNTDPLQKLFVRQVIASVLGECTYYMANKRKQTDWRVECTDAEYIEIREKIDFYWKAFNEDLKIFFSAFIQKNHLYKKPDPSKGKEQSLPLITGEEKQRLLQTVTMMQGLQKRTHRRQIEAQLS